jgi:hypothetical protein
VADPALTAEAGVPGKTIIAKTARMKGKACSSSLRLWGDRCDMLRTSESLTAQGGEAHEQGKTVDTCLMISAKYVEDDHGRSWLRAGVSMGYEEHS